MKKYTIIILCCIYLLVLSFGSVISFKYGLCLSKPRRVAVYPVIPDQEIHYNDYVEVVNGFYTGSKGTVCERDDDEPKDEVRLAIKDKEGWCRAVITIKIKDIRKISKGE
jgi:transcription antitermination factor NusG